MNFIKHLIDPNRLLLIWQDTKETKGKEYVIGELRKISNGDVELRYLTNSKEFCELRIKPYPAFPDFNKIYNNNVIDTFTMRLPPRKRRDFNQYLKSIRIPPDTKISDFTLLGYSRATLPGDNYSIFHPFESIKIPFEFITEVDNIESVNIRDIEIGKEVFFKYDKVNSISIKFNNKHIGYVKQLYIPLFYRIRNYNIKGFYERKSNSQNRIYIFVSVF